MAQMIRCQIEGDDEPVMLNLDHVVLMKPQPGQTGKTFVELANGRTFWIMTEMAVVSDALVADPSGGMIDAVSVDAAPVLTVEAVKL
jgi:hypothetical protein